MVAALAGDRCPVVEQANGEPLTYHTKIETKGTELRTAAFLRSRTFAVTAARRKVLLLHNGEESYHRKFRNEHGRGD